MATSNRSSTEPELVIYQSTGSWAALYADGSLEHTGDRQSIERSALRRLGIRTVVSDDFLLGSDDPGDIAKSLVEIREYQILRESGEAEPQFLERYAERLEEEAAIIAERARLVWEEARLSRAQGTPTEEAQRLMRVLKGSLSVD